MQDRPLSDRDVYERRSDVAQTMEATFSAVSWSAIIAGALAATAITMILMALGSGIGLASMTPWSRNDVSPRTVTFMTAVWLIIVQAVAAAVGGYMTGRLRTKWVTVHAREVFFRDSAHGFLSWALSLVLTMFFLGMAFAPNLTGSGQALMGPMTDGGPGATSPMPSSFDALFQGGNGGSDPAAQSEAMRLLGKGVLGDLTDTERARLTQLVAQRTGMSQTEADRRVTDVLAQGKSAADAARRAGMRLAFFSFVAMLIGALMASSAAARGGRRRDQF